MNGDIHVISVKDDDDGQRLDRWLKRHVPDMPYVLAQKLLRKGAIRVDGKRAKPDTRLSGGQEVKIPPYKNNPDQPPKNPKKLSIADAQFIQSLVIYDDGDVIALNKPYGIATQGGTNMKRHIDGMLDALKNNDGESLCSIPVEKLNSGNSEIRNWITVAGAAGHLKNEWQEYVPCYRSAAGTGCGMGFALLK